MSCKKKSINNEEKECECNDNCDKEEENKSQDELQSLKQDLNQTKELLLRTAAEYDNFRKRSEREKEAIYSDAASLSILSILPLADSLDAAEKSAKSGGEEYQKGIELLKNQMASAFKNLNVEPFGIIGDAFDPNIHNAVMHTEDESENQNFISEVFQKGYKIGDRIIRHAMVQVTN